MPHATIDELQKWGCGKLPDAIGFQVLEAQPGRLVGQMEIKDSMLAPNGYLHAASVVALADTAAGYGTMFDLPPTASGFTTIELKTNFVGTCLRGTVRCEATRQHAGRTTQVWDAVVRSERTGKTLALFRCTQIILAKPSE